MHAVLARSFCFMSNMSNMLAFCEAFSLIDGGGICSVDAAFFSSLALEVPLCCPSSLSSLQIALPTVRTPTDLANI